MCIPSVAPVSLVTVYFLYYVSYIDQQEDVCRGQRIIKSPVCKETMECYEDVLYSPKITTWFTMSSPQCLIQLQARDTLSIPASLKRVMVMGPYLQLMVQCGLSYLNTEYTEPLYYFFGREGRGTCGGQRSFLLALYLSFGCGIPSLKLKRSIWLGWLASGSWDLLVFAAHRLVHRGLLPCLALSMGSRIWAHILMFALQAVCPLSYHPRPSSCLCSVVRSHSEWSRHGDSAL